MGYASQLGGEIAIVPPLTPQELKNSPYIEGYRNSSYQPNVHIRVEEKEVEHPDYGTATVKVGVAVEPALRWLDGERWSAYTIEEDLVKLVRHHKLKPERLGGYIWRSGEESGDVARYHFNPTDGRLAVEQAIMQWPDGSTVDKSLYER